MNRILIVDDELRDAGMIYKAIELCLKYLDHSNDYEIHLADNVETAKKIISKDPYSLVITDLFMPTGDFANDLDVKCDEMEYPHGIQLLAALKDAKVKKLVTTFFWDYPGFTRFTKTFEQLGVHAALPKDLFYMVGLLSPGAEPGDCSPFRILVLMLSELLVTTGQQYTGSRLSSLRFRSLFEEACAWLSTHPHLVFEARKLVSEVKQAAKLAQSKPSRGASPKKASAWEEAGDVVEYTHDSLWLPSFEFSSPSSDQRAHDGHYKSLIQDTRGNDWNLCMRTAKPMRLDKSGNQRVRKFEYGGTQQSIKSHPSSIEPIRIEKFLKPPGDSHYVELLLTLSFFSYWCHLPDHRALLTPEQIAYIINKRTGTPYKGLSPREASEAISKDLELLSLRIVETIRKEHNYGWWQFLKRNLVKNSVSPIEHRRDKQYHYWLNASLLLVSD